MCWCNPNIRTPQCKSTNCIPPTKLEAAIRSWESPQTDMFPRETAIELLKGAGILDEDGKLKGTFKGATL